MQSGLPGKPIWVWVRKSGTHNIQDHSVCIDEIMYPDLLAGQVMVPGAYLLMVCWPMRTWFRCCHCGQCLRIGWRRGGRSVGIHPPPRTVCHQSTPDCLPSRKTGTQGHLLFQGVPQLVREASPPAPELCPRTRVWVPVGKGEAVQSTLRLPPLG